MKKIILGVLITLIGFVANGQNLQWEDFLNSSYPTNFTNRSEVTDIYIKVGNSFKYFIVSTGRHLTNQKSGIFDPTKPLSTANWLIINGNGGNVSGLQSIGQPFSVDSNLDGKVDKVFYLQSISNAGGHINIYDSIKKMEINYVSGSYQSNYITPISTWSLPIPTVSNNYREIIQIGNEIYVYGNNGGNTPYKLYKTSLVDFLDTNSAVNWSLISSSSNPIPISKLFNKQGKLSIAVGGTNSGIYSLNNLSWVKVATIHSDIVSGGNDWKIIKYRHLGDIIFHKIDNQSYIFDEYSTITTPLTTAWAITESRYNIDGFMNEKVFCDDYVYYGVSNNQLSRLKLPKPKFDLLSTPANKLLYEQDGFYFQPIASNALKLRGYDLGISNQNYFIGVATGQSGNVWNNNPIPSLEKWITNTADIQAINNGTFDLKAWMIANYNPDGDNNPTTNPFQTGIGKVYKVSIAVGNPWTARPAIIKF